MLYPTKIGLPDGLRTEMGALLNARLADATDLSLQAKQAHWNVKGPAFYALHQLFDEVHEAARGWADDLAERAAQLGVPVDGTLEVIAEQSTLPKYEVPNDGGRAHVGALSRSVAHLGKQIRQGIDAADEAGDAATEDLLTEIVRRADALLWMLEAHLHTEE